MQNSSAFQIIAIDQIHESATNPRQTFEESKLHELAESIRQHGLIQPITVRPMGDGFEIVAGWSRPATLSSCPPRSCADLSTVSRFRDRDGLGRAVPA